MSLLLLVFCLQGSPEYYLDRERISLNDMLDTGGRLYVRAKRLEEPLGLIWRTTLDGTSVGIYREKFGGAIFSLGNGRDAVVHSRSLFLSLPALEQRLGIRIEQAGARTTLRSEGGKAPPPKQAGLVAGDRMVDLKLPLLKNVDRTESLSKRGRGKRILVLFWAPWDASREVLLKWQALYRKFRRHDLLVIGIALDAAGNEQSRKYLPWKVTFPVLLDTGWKSMNVLGVEALPFWALVDERGFLRGMGQRMEDAGKAFEKLEKPRGGKRTVWILDQEGILPGSRWEAISTAAAMWKVGKKEEGIEVLREYLKKNEEDRLLRHQKWSVEFPEQMYGAALDPTWLKSQEKGERTGG